MGHSIAITLLTAMCCLQQMQCYIQPRPLLAAGCRSNLTTDHHSAATPAPNSAGGIAKLLMVVQNYRALSCLHEVKTDNHPKNAWTLVYLLAAKPKPSKTQLWWATRCQKLLDTDGPLPSEELYDEIWPNIAKDKSYNEIYVERQWLKQGYCVKKNVKYEISEEHQYCTKGSTDTDKLANCYYKQAELLYKKGVQTLSTSAAMGMMVQEEVDVSSFLTKVLQDIFKGSSTEGLKLTPAEVQTSFCKFTKMEVNPYLGCQKIGTTSDCYLTRVGLCFKCSIKDPGDAVPNFCTPRSDPNNPAPGTLANCPSMTQQKTLPWNYKDDHKDISCYQCDKVRYTPPITTTKLKDSC